MVFKYKEAAVFHWMVNLFQNKFNLMFIGEHICDKPLVLTSNIAYHQKQSKKIKQQDIPDMKYQFHLSDVVKTIK